jgi:diguanylate cyclase (GGDEF)-like protein
MANPVKSAVKAGWPLAVGSAVGAVATTAVVWPRLRRLTAATEVDELTGLGNRRCLQQLAVKGPDPRSSGWVAFCDLDGFKSVNDDLGHDAGDKVLRAMAAILRASVRPGDVVCRVGGDEFVLVLWSCTHPEATRIVERVRHEVALSAGRVPCTLSVGLSEVVSIGALPRAVASADRALLAAKHAGRDRVVEAASVD